MEKFQEIILLVAVFDSVYDALGLRYLNSLNLEFDDKGGHKVQELCVVQVF